ncbi:MAG: cysteine--tRNA ligase [Candidatus Falkowbacteria bacterium]|nr:cysteine--tRNA ligase [Candidatus Falkowbacteria bacterium]
MDNKIFLYNTLSNRKEEFNSESSEVGLYTCGPTVYNFAHIGNLRTYIFEDLLKRTLSYFDYPVKHVMNITDVGHLVGDMDMGEDKMESGALREGRSAWDIASFYTEAFKSDLQHLNIIEPNIYCRATDHINEQIALIARLEEKGFTYKTSDGIYFNTALIKDYNKLSHLPLEELQEGARVEKNLEKKNSTDFALWKFSPVGSNRQMEWDSPWGIGFPGWHIECSAMSLRYLSGQLDIHCGGVDHINIHHTNEIAQSEAATGEKFFNYWLHGAFLIVPGGKKMAKSSGDFLTLENTFISQDIDPLAYRFLLLQGHYRKPMEWRPDSALNALSGLESLRRKITELKSETSGEGRLIDSFVSRFRAALADDLNIPQALALVQELLKSDEEANDRLKTILNFDAVLGLGLAHISRDDLSLGSLPDDIKKLLTARNSARDSKDWSESDRLRDEIRSRGYLVEDTKDGMKISKA